jgi:hypothetical protein
VPQKSWASQASIKSIHPRVLVGSWRALKNCDWSHADFWAKLLKQTDPQIATLYQLSWLQISPVDQKKLQKHSRDETNEDSETWKWKSKALQDQLGPELWPELWIDEWNLISQKNLCSNRPLSQIQFETLPRSLIQPLVMPLYSSVAASPIPPALEKTLKNYALFLWEQGKKIDIKNQELQSCEWDALRLLHSENPTEKKYEELTQKCSRESASLWAIVRISLGDNYLKKGLFKKAFQLYHSSYNLVQDRQIPTGLDYRMVVSGFLSQAPDDFMLRTSSYLLSENTLEPLFQSTLQNLVCDSLSSLNPRDASQLLTRVFHSGHLIPQTLLLTQNCTNTEILPLWKFLAPQVKTPKEKILITGRLLALSLALNSKNHSAPDIRAYVQTLARGSHEYPFLASQQLWSAISSPFMSKAVLTEEIIYAYKRHSNWLSLDEQRLKNRMTQKALALKSPAEKLQVDAQQSNSVVHLPVVSADLPQLKLSVHTQEDFLSAFMEESGIQASQSLFESENPNVQATR